jgi:hypothetical protein
MLLNLFFYVKCVVDPSNPKGVTRGEETAYPSGAPEFTPILSGVHLFRSLVFCVVFCRWLFVVLVIMFFVLRIFSNSDYPMSNFNPYFI